MKYKSTARWRDLEDKHLYEKGDEFPHDGREIPDERIAYLMGTQNKAGFATIEAIVEAAKGKPVKEAGQAKKPVRSRKNNK